MPALDRFVNSGGLVYIISEKILHFYSNISQNIANFELLKDPLHHGEAAI